MVSGVIVGNDGEFIIVNDTMYKLPKRLFGIQSVSVDGHKIYANGYKFVKGKWKITLMSLFNHFF